MDAEHFQLYLAIEYPRYISLKSQEDTEYKDGLKNSTWEPSSLLHLRAYANVYSRDATVGPTAEKSTSLPVPLFYIENPHIWDLSIQV